jgi:hypothetical protein
MERFTRRVVGSAVALVLIASACGGRSSGSKASGSGATTGTSGSASGDFGTLKAVCGPGNAKGATDPGVTDTSISVATMADPGATIRPGLDQELFDSADAFVGWCNAAGGILGRKLTLHKRDAALFQVAAKMVEACQAPDFALVGNGEGLDATGVQQRVGCKLPELAGFDVSSQASSAPYSVQSTPSRTNQGPSGGSYRALAKVDPSVIKHYGMLSSTLQSVKDAGTRNRKSAESLGYVTVDYEELPGQVDNWRPIVENLKTHGVQVLAIENDPDGTSAMLKTMTDVGYFPKYIILEPNMYDPKLTNQAGSALNGPQGGVYVTNYIVPFELADQYPATKQYINLLTQYANGAKPKSLGVNGFSAWLLFAESAKACGSNLTRTCLLDHAQATKNWTAGGLMSPWQPGNATTGGHDCNVMFKATASGFSVDKEITAPNQGIFNCDPANSVVVNG